MKMDKIRGFIDGHIFFENSPFSSRYFRIASFVGLVSVVVDVYLIVEHWHALNIIVTVLLGAQIGVQLIYQWWRTWSYYSKIRKLYSMKSEEEAKEGSPLDLALRIAAGGLTDGLFYSYGMTLVALFIIGILLTRLGNG